MHMYYMYVRTYIRVGMYICTCVYYVCMWMILLCSFEKRLLHPGANTSDIITQYISSVKV